jgi:hypothetical protein
VTTSLHSLLLARRQLNEQIRRARQAEKPRKAKRKVKQKSQADKDREREYYRLLANSERCWACERTREQVPPWWKAEFTLVRAHFANKPRIEDCRVVVVLCSSCHYLNHNRSIGGCDLPPLTNEHLLWLKIENDAPIDWPFIHKCGGAGLNPAPLPVEFWRERGRNQSRVRERE